MKLLVTLLIILVSLETRADCCEFEFRPIAATMNVPSNSALDLCSESEGCDKRFVSAGKMINAIVENNPEEVDYLFRQLLGIIKEYPDNDLISLNIVFAYASFLNLNGDSESAIPYYKWISSNSEEGSVLEMLSQVGVADISGNVFGLKLLIEDFKTKVESNSVSADEAASIIVILGYCLPEKDKYGLFSDFYYLYDDIDNPEVRYYFLSSVEFYFAQAGDYRYEEVLNVLEKALKNISADKYSGTNYGVLSRKEFNKGNYAKALEYSRAEVVSAFGEFNKEEELLGLIDGKSSKDLLSLRQFARYNLYQTRLGKGIEPVKKAYSIYYSVYENQLFKGIRSVSSSLVNVDISVNENVINSLVVGNYLYDKTGDLTYLENSIFLLESFRGKGLQTWLKIRERIRNGDSFLPSEKSISDKRQKFHSYDMKKGLEGLVKEHDSLKKEKIAFVEEQSDLFLEIQEDCRISLQSTQFQAAEDSSAILSFYQNSNALYRLLLTGDTIAVDILNGVRTEAMTLATSLSAEVQIPNQGEGLDKNSRRLFELLFGDIEELLPKRVSIIAGGVLTEIPFSALRMEQAGEKARYFGVEHAISRQFSIRSKQMLEEVELSPKYEQPLAMAPSFRSEWLLAGELRQAGFVIPPLKYNQEEVEKLSDLSGGRFMTGEGATVANYKKYAKDYGLIHLATHAISSREDGLKSHVLLLDENGSPEPLYASEIGDETLNADLVVLSACETGGGLLHATEGTVGLTKAYLAAGARAVVASSWAVDDHATAELMDNFYEALSAGKRTDDALRDARAAYLQKHPETRPDKWAAFEAYGGMKAPGWDKSSNPFKGAWIWLLAGLGLLAGVLMVRKMKHA